MPSGFVNLGNTCYVNSVLQCFLKCGPLNTLLDATTIRPTTPDQVFLKEYDDLRRLAQSGNVTVRPERFVHFIQGYAKHRKVAEFSSLGQKDVCEFAHFLVDAFHSAYCSEKAPDPATQSREMVAGKFQSPIIQLFFGVHVHTVVKGETVLASTPEPFFLLDLPIPPGAANLVDCLHAYVQADSIEGWRDEHGVSHDVQRRCAFALLPPILFISLKRFNAAIRKDTSSIDVPETLVVGPIVYKLEAVCVHSGSVGGGHYTACVRHDSGWACVDDDVITPTTTPTKGGYCFVFVQEKS
jgi:ubiquitin C-terminal hydrolase